MAKLITYTRSDIEKLVTKQDDEPKIGQHIHCLNGNSTAIYEQLGKLDVDYVIFGISESLGSIANNGKSGTSTSWEIVLKRLLNLRANPQNTGINCLVLGHFDCSDFTEIINKLDLNKKGDRKKVYGLVDKLDRLVTQLVFEIKKAGKTPVVIGGSHSNAYGILKGTALAEKKAVNAINFDAHSDFGHTNGRHNGNAFSYAFNEGFLDRYMIFGLHEAYIPDYVYSTIKKLKKRIRFFSVEELFVRRESKFRSALQESLSFISDGSFGIEIDCDSIENMPCISSTLSGLSANQVREAINLLGSHTNVAYLHICGAALDDSGKRSTTKASKLIAYMMIDFMQSASNRN